MKEENHKYSKKLALGMLVGVLFLLGLAYTLVYPTITGLVTAASGEINNDLITNSQIEIEQDKILLEKKVIALRDASLNRDIVEIARIYTEIEQETATNRLEWRAVANCVYQRCEDQLYLNLIKSIVSTKDDDISTYVYELIETHDLWNSRNEALFSQYLTKTNQRTLNKNEDIKAKWQEFVACDGCEEGDSIVFEIVKLTFDYS